MTRILGRGLLFAAACLLSAACAGRQIYRPMGCERRLASPEKVVACRACVTRPRPHVYLADAPEGERCVPR